MLVRFAVVLVVAVVSWALGVSVGVSRSSAAPILVDCLDKSGQARFYSQLDAGTYIVHAILAEPENSAIVKKPVGDSATMYQWLFVWDIPGDRLKTGTVIVVDSKGQK